MALPLLLGGLAIGSSLFGAWSQKKAADRGARQQEELGRLNASYILAETEEDLRRQRDTFTRVENLAFTMTAASGLGGQTRRMYQDVLAAKHQAELDWMEKSGRSRAAIARRSGQYQSDALRSQGQAAMWQGLGNAAGIGLKLL